MRGVYSALFYLALPLIILRLLWRSRRLPGLRERFKERLGWVPILKECIWVHAVSVGETLAAIPLIKELKKEYPHLPVLVSNMTPTGAARVKAAFGNSVHQVFIPYDLPGAVARFLRRVNPKIAVVMETELWPNLFAACRKQQIPILLANARLSEKSYQGYKKVHKIASEMLQSIHTLAAQNRADADRFIALGMDSKRVVITGNLKFDLEVPADLALKSENLRQQIGQRPCWVAASTHASEEETVINAHRLILKECPNALLILVPRHPDRFNLVAQLCEQWGFQVMRRSQGGFLTPDTTIYLADTMGELLLMYATADVALVAGSFAPIGGHNMLEPAVLKKPILTGPQLFNFAEISQLLIQEKGMQVVSPDNLADHVLKLFSDPHYRETMGEQAYQVVAKNRGSLSKQLSLIKLCMGHPQRCIS